MLFLRKQRELPFAAAAMRAIYYSIALYLTVALTACGGGGGGGSGGNGGGATTNNATNSLSVSQSKSSMSFQGIIQASASKTYSYDSIEFIATGGTGSYYAGAVADNPELFAWDLTVTGQNSATVTIAPQNVPAGTYTGTITFVLCNDENCNSVAWQKSVPYSMQVFDVAASSLTITGAEGATSSPQAISISPADSQGALSVTSTDSWVVLDRPSDSSVTVAASGTGMTSGSYQGNVRIAFFGNPSLYADVPVSLTLGTGIVAPPAKTIDLAYSTSSSALTGDFPVAFSGGQNASWSASSDASWLILTNASGTGAGSIQYSIDTNQVASLPNWASSVANVTISADGFTDASFSVTLNKKLPEVYSVWPNPIPTSGGAVKVYGKGFNQLSGWSAIQIQGVTPTSGSITSDMAATVTLPALSAGNYALSIPNTLSLSSAGSSLVAASAQPFAYATANNLGEKRCIIFDGTRNSVFAINITQSTLVRYRLVAAQWVVDGLPISSIGNMAMSSDKTTLYVTTGSNQLIAIDPDTLQIKQTYSAPLNLASNTLYFQPALATTFDNRIWINSSYYFDATNAVFTTTDATPAWFGYLYGYSDGSGMVQMRNLGGTSYLYFASGTPATAATTLPAFNDIVLSADGKKGVLDDIALYDMTTQALIGNIQDPGIITNAVFSPSGDRVYAFATASHNSLAVTHIDVFDTTLPTDGTSNLVKLGEIAVTDQAWDCPGYPYGCDVHGRLTINTIGNTLFWAGDQRLVVIPVPSGLSDISVAPRRYIPSISRAR